MRRRSSSGSAASSRRVRSCFTRPDAGAPELAGLDQPKLSAAQHLLENLQAAKFSDMLPVAQTQPDVVTARMPVILNDAHAAYHLLVLPHLAVDPSLLLLVGERHPAVPLGIVPIVGHGGSLSPASGIDHFAG